MNNSKKVLNVFGIIFASILSIVLVLSLIVSPIIMSSLSIINPKKLTKVITTEQLAQIITDSDNAEENKAMAELLSTNAAKEVFELYAADITSSLQGKNESKFTAEALQKIAEENMDELVAFMREQGGASDMSDDEIKAAITEGLKNKEDGLFEMLPKPQELKEQLIAENPELEAPLEIIGSVNRIKFGIIAYLIVVSALIFVCRLFELRGFKWLSVDLFVASGILILVCIGLGATSGIVSEMLATEAAIGGLVTGVVSSFTTGIIIRSVVVLVAAIGLIVAHVLVKKARTKKLAVIDAPVDTVIVETEEEPKETV